MLNLRNIVRFVVSMVYGLTFVQSIYSLMEHCGKPIALPPFLYVVFVSFCGIMIFIVSGFWLEGYLVTKATIFVKSLGMVIQINRGNILNEDGVVVVGVNDFFDTLVDDHHISPKSLQGKVIKEYWGGNICDLDAQLAYGLKGVKYEVVARDGKAKERRFQIGTSVMVKSSCGKRFLFVALSKTNAITNRTHSSLQDLSTAVRGALAVAREEANGDDVSFPLMGRGNSRIKAPEQVLFYKLLTTIMAECLENEKVANQVNVVLCKGALKQLNMFALEKEWDV